MSTSFDGAAPSPDERVAELLAQAARFARQQQPAEARRVFREAETLHPTHPLVLHEKGRQLLLSGDASGALSVFQQLVQVAPRQVNHWMSLAATLRRLEQREAEMAALEKALALEPAHLVVLLQKGALLELMNKPRAAAVVYTHALQTLSPQARLPAAIEAHVAHARKRANENATALAAALDARLASLSEVHPRGGSERLRFDRCVDRILGRQRVYTPEPTGTLFPYLCNYEFYPREMFPWLAGLEANAQVIREELLTVLREEQAEILPYIAYPEGVPLNQWKELNNSRRWGAYFLWNQGKRVDSHMARCPRTSAALAGLPQVDVPGRGPTAYFSILEPHTHIPAHTGVNNARLIVHLPLILPGLCRFRVGGEVREWREGEAWVFDDTIEHEAWNDADLPRVILILDVWNPQLTALERDLMREMFITLQAFNDEGDQPAIAGI
jgi:aspartyl/asparaginyl beta-hydroxylase (cupin superfamily)